MPPRLNPLDHSFALTLLVAVLSAVLLCSCASVPPEPHAVAQPDAAPAELPADIRLAGAQAWPAQRWWASYGDAQLDALVDRALQASPSLAAAAARVEAARSALVVSRAAAGAEAGVSADANRQHYSANGLLPPPIGGASFNEFSVKLQARYDFDLWGRNRAQVAAAAGEAFAREAEQVQVREKVGGAVARSYFELQSLWALAANLREQAAAQQLLVDDKARRIVHGLASADEARVEQARLAELRARIAEAEAGAVGQREALRALLGHGDDAIATLQPRPLPTGQAMLPQRLGYELLARRPDLQAARWRVEASMSRVEAARAAFYPDVNLAASVGLDSLTLPNLLKTASRTFFAGPSLALPLFTTGALKGQLGGARSARDELIADYDHRVLDAVRDVAQAAAALQGLAAQASQQHEATVLTQAQQRSSEARLRQGLADRAATVQAGLAVLRERQAGLQLDRQRLQTEVALTQALGGGFHAEASTQISRN
ncbi:efflux transporter outer membrane subunit [Roseateles saccharophilus]|uniref:Multidrug efflux system outer membrane protein n=1 Tax=Roseateles saccharophilus TaxID=304 RepID=A0A4R3V629_ROSSA|nr:efflux transporter outer membrane subunit [Roseateles saccharophilus]MDG0834997.1 efflux transporter outer membrane subunit [Roseateles saccharophilus]TCV00416.1 multidrug efflux system outer membrane protein [Roseateles saccharophilus]